MIDKAVITKEEIARGYDAILGRMGLDLDFYNRALNMPEKITGEVLDIGCGAGHLLQLMQTRAIEPVHFFGVDISPKLVESTRQKNPKSEVMVGDAESLAYPDKKFDLIFMTECLEHLLNFDKAISEANRVLKTGGRFVVTVPNRDWLQYDFYKPFMEANVHQPVDDHYFRVTELEELLNNNGFKILKIKGSDNLFYYGWKHKLEQVAAFFVPSLYKKMKRLIVLAEKA
jgi:ubiquinone/menaquinone biosynthesis C-methylase UbiE